MHRRARARATNALLLLGGTLFALVCLEGVFAFALSHPRMLASRDGTIGIALARARDYYVTQDRKSVQFLAECARFDPDVSYTLIPGGKCRVVNREHTVEYAANRAGLRDSEDALARPDVIVIGDSHAMGWGVRAEEAFPKRLQEILHRTVLNAGMSSFGPARELTLLERLDLPTVGTLVIQYADNDYAENQRYVESGVLNILPEWQYRAVVQEHRRWTRYYPFKHLTASLPSIAHPIERSRESAPQVTDELGEAGYFLDVLLRHRAAIEGRTVVVIEINPYQKSRGGLVAGVRQLLLERRYASLAPWVSAIDVSPALGPEDYYLLDDHMRAAGRAKVAGLVAAELRRRAASH